MAKAQSLDTPNRIRQLRLDRDMKLDDLRKLLGTSKSQLARLETGERDLTLPWMQRIAAALGVTPADLLWPVDSGLERAEREWIDIARDVPAANRAAINTFMEHQQPFRAAPDVTDLVPRKTG